MKKRSIRKKIATIILITALSAVFISGLVSAGIMFNMRSDSVNTLLEQKKSELLSLAENKSATAERSLKLIYNQTNLVRLSVQSVFENKDTYLTGTVTDQDLSWIGFYNEEYLNTYSQCLRAPDDLLTDIKRDPDDDTIILSAKMDYAKLTDEEKKELYLARYCQNAIGGIQNFWNGEKSEDGSPNYTGIGASYFCFASSGIDVLADTLTTRTVSYDARNSSWYKGAAQLQEGEVFWTNPVPDGAGRGVALICAMPIYADMNNDGQKELIGVAGSGGLIENIRELVQSTKIGDSGYAMMLNNQDGKLNLITSGNVDRDGNLKSSEIENDVDENGKSVDQLKISDNAELNAVLDDISQKKSGISQILLDGEQRYVAYVPLGNINWVMVTVLSEKDGVIAEPINLLTQQVMFSGIIFVIILIVLVVIIIISSYKFSNRITKPISRLTEGAKIVSEGNLEHQICVSKTNDEIEDLGFAFNNMTISLKEYITNLSAVTKEKQRIGAELDIARHIQSSMLPCIFPAFPERKEIDIYATMDPAKEVGGDFYDFFMVDESHLAIVVADVSGKGVPAALFMVIGKTLIKDHTNPGDDLGGVFAEVNELLCESNSEGLFITAFEGVLDMVSGEFTYVNAGHELPFWAKAGEPFTVQKIKAGFVLAGMEGMRYKAGQFTMSPGDRLFEYTDGVTEATNSGNELYGMERLEAVLNRNLDKNPTELLPAVKEDIDAFVAEAPQFDDITMLCMEFKEYTTKDKKTGAAE